jgi:protein DJ-1
LLSHKLAYGKNVTSYPAFREKMSAEYKWLEDRVVRDENLITSQGPGTTFEFALKIVEYLLGAEKSQSLVEPMRLKL